MNNAPHQCNNDMPAPLTRKPTDAERKRADQYLLNEARALIPVKGGNKDEASALSWATFCQALFACAEFRYLR